MKESIINYLKEHGKSSVNDIAHALNHAGVVKSSHSLSKSYQLWKGRDSCALIETALYPLRPKKEHPNQVTVEGVFHANKNGFGFLHVDDSEDDMFIGRNDVGHAIDGDTVAAVIKKPAIVCVGQWLKQELLKLSNALFKTVVGKFILNDEKEPYVGYIKSKNQKFSNQSISRKDQLLLRGLRLLRLILKNTLTAITIIL